MNKCSSIEHKEIIASSYCGKCRIYLCNKCLNFHSKLFNEHEIFNLDKINNELFTGFCQEENHNNELKFFCKTHNQLCCAICLCKIKTQNTGKHKDCDTCLIEDIKDEKKTILKDSIKYLEDLSKKIIDSITNLKNIFEKINKDKEDIKKDIQNIFTKIRNELNYREDVLLFEVEKKFDDLYINDEIINETQKLPKKVEVLLKNGRMIDNNYNKNELNRMINDCIIIEKNINEIKNIKDKFEKCKNYKTRKFKFYPEIDKIDIILEKLKKFVTTIDVINSSLIKISNIINLNILI